MESHNDERGHAPAAGPVAVIYVSVEAAGPAGRRCDQEAPDLLRAAAVYLNRMADYVDELRRSLERRGL